MFSAILSILNYKILLSKCDISQEHAGLLKGLEKLIDKLQLRSLSWEPNMAVMPSHNLPVGTMLFTNAD